MRVVLPYGLDHLEIDIPEDRLVGIRSQPATEPVTDLGAAVREALEHPRRFPPLRQALTPDDHVAILVDDKLPRVGELLNPILEHLVQAQIEPSAITLLCPASSDGQPWVDDLGEEFEEVHVEVHDPKDRRHLSYLATTRRGRRVYLNRTAVDADQLVILSRRDYDPVLGYSGSEAALFPAFSDEATRQELGSHLSLDVPGGGPWPVQQEATEVAWLLGAPFMVQVIAGSGGGVLHVLGGLADTTPDGEQLLDARWRKMVDSPADTVIATVGGDPATQDFADLARGLACAARVVRTNGRIILLSQVGPDLGPAGAFLRQAAEPERAMQLLLEGRPPGMAAAFQWLSGVQSAKVYLLSGLPAEAVEELFAVPLEKASQVQRLIVGPGTYLVLPDAHRTLAVTE